MNYCRMTKFRKEIILMPMRYSDLTIEQLREKLSELIEKSQKAEQFGNISEVEIYERKIQLISSYMMNPDQFQPGDVHYLTGDAGYTFKINYIDGVMAWG